MKFITNTSDLAKFLNKKIKFNALIKSISTDTRSLKKNSLFIAIKGENFDGNNVSSPSIENSFESKKTEESIQGVEIDDEVPF